MNNRKKIACVIANCRCIKRVTFTGGYLTVEDAPYHTPLGAAFLQAGEEMGYDIVDVNGEQQTGFAFYQFTMRRGSRCSTAKAFLRPIRLRKNLHVSLQSHVLRIVVDPQTKRAVGVEFIKENGQPQIAYAKREVILSAGAIGSPHILLNSGIGPRKHLEDVGVTVTHDLPGVGQNLQDHVAIGGLAFTINKAAGIVANRMINFNSALRYALSEEGPLTSSIGLEVVAFLNTKYANKSDDWPDMNFLMTSASIFSDQQVKLAHGLKPEFYQDMYSELQDKDAFSILPMILRPKSRGFIKLRSSHPLDYPLLFHNYLTHPEDIAVMREGVKLAIATAETQALKEFGAQFHDKPLPNCRHLPRYTDEYWECVIKQYTMTIYHMSGTCKMGPKSDPMAVVNHKLQVHGIKGLRVIDASIMPTVTSGNTNAPTIMIGEKGSDFVKGLWLREEMYRNGRYKRKINETKTNSK